LGVTTTPLQMGCQQNPVAARAITMPVASELSQKEREALAEDLGYRQIGAELPKDVSLSNIIQSLPSEVASAPFQWSIILKSCQEGNWLLNLCIVLAFLPCNGRHTKGYG